MYNKWMFLDWYFINIVKFFTTFYPTPLISISEVIEFEFKFEFIWNIQYNDNI